jgi:L-erythrulose 1-phosphate isomerase
MAVSGNRPSFFFGTNLKMHQTPAETAAFLDDLLSEVGDISPERRLFVIPSFTSLPAASEHPAHTRIWIGAQTMHWAEDGAFTGEVAPRMLAALGLDLVLLGHAERRAHAGETDDLINRKVHAALRHGLRVLLCVGETAAERDFGVGGETVVRQLKIALHGVPAEKAERVMVAYEPVWSIGEGGTPATPNEALPVVRLLRRRLRLIFQRDDAVPVLYGGSVNAQNAASFAALPDLDGLFVGRSAWSPAGFAAVLKEATRVRFGGASGMHP